MAILHRIVVASDSFKGSLPSWEVAEAVEKAVREVCPDCAVTCLSVADGGEGTTEALCKAFSGEMLTIRVRGPLSDPVEARYCIAGEAGKRTAVLGMSQVMGAGVVPGIIGLVVLVFAILLLALRPVTGIVIDPFIALPAGGAAGLSFKERLSLVPFEALTGLVLSLGTIAWSAIF